MIPLAGDDSTISAVLVLADASAAYVLGGLSQLDRLLATLDECFSTHAMVAKPEITVLWRSAAHREEWFCSPPPPRSLRSQLTHRVPNDLPSLGKLGAGTRVLVVATTMVFGRQALCRLLKDARLAPPFVVISDDDAARLWRAPDPWQALSSSLPQLLVVRTATVFAATLAGPDDICRIELDLFRSLGKSTDGPVSRALNRRVSAVISRRLAAAGVSPRQASFLTGGVAVAGAVALALGESTGLIAGLGLYQVASTLDGCDGELARVGFRESREGARLDNLFDHLSFFLLPIGLGIGLARSPGAEGFRTGSPVEAAVIAAARALNFAALVCLGRLSKQDQPGRAIKDEILEHAHASRLWRRIVSGALFLLGRDSSTVLFLLLAIAGQPGLILHCLAAGTLLEMGGVVWSILRRTGMSRRLTPRP